MKKAFLSGALVMAAASFIAIGAQATSADAALLSATVKYANETLSIEAQEGEDASQKDVHYRFYTTAKVSTKSVPANNKWIKLEQENTLDISAMTKKTTVYFAETPNPVDAENVLKVEIPAQRKITGLTYTAGKNTVKDTFLSKAKYGSAQTAGKLAADAIVLEDNNKMLDAFYASKDYRTAQKKGQTIQVRYKAESTLATITADKEKDKNDKETGLWIASVNESNDDVKTLRPSAVCSVKIKQAPAAPAVKINYANHTMQVKQGQLYNTAPGYNADSWDSATGDPWKVPTLKDKDKFEDVVVESNQIYAVGTDAVENKSPRSLLTYVSVPSTPDFKTSGGAVIVNGKTVPEGADEKRSVTLQFSGADMKYQYCIVANAEKYFKDTGFFDYAAALADEKAKTLKWTAVNVPKSATKKNVVIKNSKKALEKKDILVRIAAGKNTFSSTMVVLKNGDAEAKWKVLYENSDTGLTDGEFTGSGTPGVEVTGEYNVASKKIVVNVTGATFADTLPETKVTVDRKEAAVTRDGETSISFPLPDDVLKKTLNGTDVTVVIPEGYILVGDASTPLDVQSMKVKVDKEGPKVVSAAAVKVADTLTKSTLTLTLDGPVKVKNDSGSFVEVNDASTILKVGDIVVKNGGGAEATEMTDVVTGAVLKKSDTNKYTIEVSIDTKGDNLKVTTLYVGLKPDSFQDLAGNSADAVLKSVKNPWGSATAKAAKVTVPTGQKTDEKDELTLELTADNALDAETVKNATVATETSGITFTKSELDTTGKKFTIKVAGAVAGDADQTVTIKVSGIKDKRGFDVTVDDITITIPKKETEAGA